MQTAWTVGYVVGQIPSNLILTRVRPSIWIPSLEVTWSVLTFCLAKCNTAEQIYAVRFLVGLAEGILRESQFVTGSYRANIAPLLLGGFYPGMQYLIGSWYRKDELGKRSCIFHTSSAIATMVRLSEVTPTILLTNAVLWLSHGRCIPSWR
jgi:MFS family permease